MIAERMVAGAAAFGSLVSSHALHRIRLIGPLATISFGFIGTSSAQLFAVPVTAAIQPQKSRSSMPSLPPTAGANSTERVKSREVRTRPSAGAANTRFPVAA